MTSLIQVLTSGIAMGFIYCLVAIEYTLIWNACGVVNFAHEKFIVVGAYVFAGAMVRAFGLDFVSGAVFMLLFMGVFGAAVAMLIINPMRNMPSGIFTIVGMMMLAYVLREAVRLIFGAYPFTVSGFLSGSFIIGGRIVIPRVYPIMVVVSIALIVLQNYFFKRTKAGKAMRCVAQDKEAAAIMGINVKRNIALTVAISAMICGLIGMLLIPLFSVDHNMAGTIAQKGFAAGVVGGFGTYTGAIAGGLFIGIMESLYMLIGPSVYKDVVAFSLMIVFLLIQPNGIMAMFNKRDRLPADAGPRAGIFKRGGRAKQ